MIIDPAQAAPLSLDLLSANMHALVGHVGGSSERLDFSRLRARERGEIVAATVFDLFFHNNLMPRALQKTHEAYHYWRDRLLERHIVPLQTYVEQGCEGENVDEQEIAPHLEQLAKFCVGTRVFFNNLSQDVCLKGVFTQFFCEKCTENGSLILNYFNLFLLQKTCGRGLPYTAFGFLSRTGRAGEAFDLFLMDLQTRRVSTSVLHRGLECFLNIHRLLYPRNTKLAEVAEIELFMQHRMLQLKKMPLIPKTSHNLFLQQDPAQLSWRQTIKPGISKVVINECGGDFWVKTEVAVGELIGGSRGDSDRFIHFRVASVRETRTPIANQPKDLLVIGQRGEEWVEVPGRYVLTIPNNLAVLGIKRLIGQMILRKEKDCLFTCAGLRPLIPLRLDHEGKCALFQELRPIPEEKRAIFARNWITVLNGLTYTPKPLPAFERVLLGEITTEEGVLECPFYLRNLRKGAKDPVKLERYTQEITAHFKVVHDAALPRLPLAS